MYSASSWDWGDGFAILYINVQLLLVSRKKRLVIDLYTVSGDGLVDRYNAK